MAPSNTAIPVLNARMIAVPLFAAGAIAVSYTHLDKDEQKDLLRFLTAGSVDDGKSTLIGQMCIRDRL